MTINNNFKSRSSSMFSYICYILANWPRLEIFAYGPGAYYESGLYPGHFNKNKKFCSNAQPCRIVDVQMNQRSTFAVSMVRWPYDIDRCIGNLCLVVSSVDAPLPSTTEQVVAFFWPLMSCLHQSI